MMDLKQFNSKELLTELTKRGYLKEINVMSYSDYELNLRAKYGAKPINTDDVTSIFIMEEHN
ncbi:hypothetical protein OZX58_03175 [Lactobacillus sp. ESL0680]|uniref:hypothetical protein n=1 Tax=Lactobacillus sp. ESL0680 TaxID=2983210 RepID=UPI0023F91BC9|nr:hypothetical protein [Lactobacillus sp. ESL0680]WEV39252.1 hypothetical protein OZX58_03175 [Lactobacillus sp. ESL0680]